MNALELGILNVAAQIDARVPNPRYSTVNRFGPGQYDCSGYTFVCYRDGARLIIGADTGAIGRDVRAGRARFIHPRDAQPSDLLMHRSGRIYDGGPDEHVGIKLYNEGSSIVSRESAGSQNGVGVYRRSASWWTDGVHYFALDKGPPLQPPPMIDPRKKDAVFLLQMGSGPDVYASDWITKRRIQDPDELGAIQWCLASYGLPTKPIPVPPAILNRVPNQ